MELKQKLKHLRKQKKLSQMELSEKLMVSRQAVSSWEAGTSRPSTENLLGLSQLYDVQIEYLLNESEDELPAPAPATESRPKRDTQRKEKKRKALDQMAGNRRSRFNSVGVLPFLVWKSAEGRWLGFAFDSRRR